ncbi:MAG TPA: hypothetical protein VJ988_12535 [Desulfobulbales bacterium]|nr:hypothetical protein [Desulfobulbales bacterium]
MDITRHQHGTAKKIGLILCFIILHFFLADLSFGQGNPGKDGPRKKPDTKWSTFIRGGYVYQFDTDLDNSNGSFTADRFFVQPGIRYAPDHTRSFSLAFGYGYDGYDFTGENSFGALQPWDDIHTFRLSTPIRFTKGQNWSFFIVPTLRVTGESGADLNDSLTGGGFAGFAYRLSERLTIGPGIGIISQIEDDASIFPVLIINWKITDTLSLETGRGLGATLGPGISLNWRMTNQWHLALGGRYEKLRFRLDDKAEAPDGIGQDKSFPVFGGITYNFNSSARVSLIGGFETAGELQLEDRNGNVLEQQDYESAKFLGFSFYSRF